MVPSRPIGATVIPGGVEYRVWAPDRRLMTAVIGRDDKPARLVPLTPGQDGYFSGIDPDGCEGDWYGFRVDEHPERTPDVASRFQPLGVFGPSEVVDPSSYHWRDTAWKRPPLRGRVIYELHVGAFTPEGSYCAAAKRLAHVARLGANTIELMPLADFPGRWNWGYDGVMLYSPARCYGRPDELRELVDAAHELDLAVVLDVVYNHFGPVGNALQHYSERYFHAEKESPWGRSLNFDGADAAPVRAFFLQNAAYWLDEFHFDGLRLDATHAIHDGSPRHVIAEVSEIARARGAFTIAEDERNEAAVISASGAGALNAGAVWADDFAHSVRVALTGDRHSYLSGYGGDPSELAKILRDGWLYQGEVFPMWNRPRGTPAGHLPPERFVYCLNNHDQTGNRALGERITVLSSPAGYRAASLLLCLAPATPMIFMGDEWGAHTPFLFFTDHPGEIGAKMAGYRKKEFAAQGAEVLARMPDPQAASTFDSSKLDWSEPEAERGAKTLALYRAALTLRSSHEHFQSAPRSAWRAHAEAPGVALRWSSPQGDWLLVTVLTAAGAHVSPDELCVPSPGRHWEPVLDSEDPEFGGGAPPGTRVLAPEFAGPRAVLYRERR